MVYKFFLADDLLLPKAMEDVEYLLDQFLADGFLSVAIHNLDDNLGRIYLVFYQFFKDKNVYG